ncbi:hypothetical protein CsSME_00019328 [Camellia sinensis var. sinensis]
MMRRLPQLHVSNLFLFYLVLHVSLASNYQMDVKSAFLNGYLKEEAYAKQPKGLRTLNVQIMSTS